MQWLELLQSKTDITDAVLQQIESSVNQGLSPEQVLTEAGVSTDVMREVLAAYFGVEAGRITDDTLPTDDLYTYIPEESARYYHMVPYAEEDGVFKIATSNPDNLQMRQAVQFLSNKIDLPFQFVYVPSAEIAVALEAYVSLTGEVDEALDSLEVQLQNEIEEKEKESGGDQSSVRHLKEDAPVTKIVATTLRYAVDGKASDIHIEPETDKVIVRFRVDGILQKSLELPVKVHPALVARVKILSSMRLDEKRKPQDGRFSANFDGRKIDFRVSVLPTNHGEKVVMRILDTAKGVRTLDDTGVGPYHMDAIRRAVREPFGIILISGPTGSGKSTTLYAMLSEVDRMTKNVLSLEDPIEYDIDHVSQSQVRPEIGYTFAAGLRSALRQDPDIIMVGEIRDKETAQLAIQAALTGHLVLSTIHTNNSIGVIPRLIDMGVDPYLIAPTLKVAIAQRLARRLCPSTGKDVPVEGAIKRMMDEQFLTLPEKYHDRIPTNQTVKTPEPSPGCNTGMRGRAAVMELLEVNEEIQELILNSGSEEQMYEVARKHGFMSMKEDAIIKALNHVIPYEEISIFGSDPLEDDVMVDVAEEERRDAAPAPVSAAVTETELPDKSETLDNLVSAPVDNRHI